MGIYNSLANKIITPASDLLLGRTITSSRKFLTESQWWDRDRIIEFQNERLRTIVAYAYENIPFYKKLYDRHGVKPSDVETIYDIKKLPVIEKKDIRRIVSQRKKVNNGAIKGISSGSTGEPLQYYKDRQTYSIDVGCGIRAWNWMGFELGDKYVKISQNPRTKIQKRFQDKVNRSLYIYLKDISDEEFAKLYPDIRSFEPLYIRSYPDPLYYFGRFMRKKGYALPTLRAINTTGNILYPEARSLIEKIFGCKIYDSYSCEGGAVVSQCENNESYHAADEYAVTEILDDDNNDVAAGEKGRCVTTDLWNTETPFIRYNTQDVLTRGENVCGCGRELTAIKNIDGRDCDILITPDGRLVIVHIFTIFFEWYDSVDQFQAIQEDVDRFRILLVVNDRFTKTHREEIQSYWSKYFGDSAQVDIEIVGKIKPRKSGKRSFLVRNEKIKLNI